MKKMIKVSIPLPKALSNQYDEVLDAKRQLRFSVVKRFLYFVVIFFVTNAFRFQTGYLIEHNLKSIWTKLSLFVYLILCLVTLFVFALIAKPFFEMLHTKDFFKVQVQTFVNKRRLVKKKK